MFYRCGCWPHVASPLKSCVVARLWLLQELIPTPLTFSFTRGFVKARMGCAVVQAN